MTTTSVTVYPFKQVDFKKDSSNAISKTFTSINTDNKQIDLQFNTVDIYGNNINNEALCTHYTHKRYLFYYNLVYYLADGET